MKHYPATVTLVSLLLSGIVCMGYNLYHGPFDPKHEPQRFPLQYCDELTSRSTSAPSGTVVRVFAPTNATAHRVLIELKRIREGKDESVVPFLTLTDTAGRVLAGSQRVADDIYWGGCESVQYADLNGDGRTDYVAWIWLGGCGLAGGYYNLAFVLSTGTQYRITVVLTLWPGPEDFVDLRRDGRCQFIHTAFVHGEPGRDGKTHNYWVYNLLEITGAELRLANHLHREFPKWIWFTFKPNHKATRQLTEEQKKRLWEEQADIFWRVAETSVSE